MQSETGDRLRKLCNQAAVEQDHDVLVKLIKEIDRLLGEKEERFRVTHSFD